MPTTTQDPTVSIGSINAQRVEGALAQIGPRWTTWSTMVLAQGDHPMRVRDVAARLPFLDEQVVFKRLNTMRVGGLVHRDLDPRREALYRLSERGESLAPVHRTMAAWHRTHLPVGRMAEAERIEDALDRLRRRHTTAVIQILDEAGPMRYVDIAERAGLGHGTTSHRLARLQTDGLVTRTGQRFGDPYVLTDAGQALGSVYASVERWSEPLVAPRKSSAPRTAAATRTHHGVPLGADARTAAALRRSAVVPTALFSHAPQPQPRVPAAVTAESAPNRAR
ncbi:winged helix-turn-helix transcriptional regulator [Streptomyces sp. DSM 41029]